MATLASDMRVVQLDERETPSAAPARQIGIVQNSIDSVGSADLIALPNDGTGDTNVVSHQGSVVAGAMAVQLIFWGSGWLDAALAPTILAERFRRAATTLIGGPYFSGLAQYGCLTRPSYAGAIIVLPDPPAVFDFDAIAELVWRLINQGVYPDPDHASGSNFFCVLMPPGTTQEHPGRERPPTGAHGHPSRDESILDVDVALVAWIANGDLDTMTRTFGHELAETITDPLGDGWYAGRAKDGEIGDLCNSRQGRLHGVWVEAYWSNGARACVIRQNHGFQLGAASAAEDELDVVVTGNDGVVYTSRWTAGSGWSGLGGWREIGGLFPVGEQVTAVARGRFRDQIDLFVVGGNGVAYTSRRPPGADWSGLAGWDAIGGVFPVGAPVAAVSRHKDALDLFIAGGDGVVYTSESTTGSQWSGLAGWRPIGGLFPAGAPIAAVATDPGKLDLFIVGNDGVVYTSSWSTTSDWSGLQGWSPLGGVFPPGTPVSAVSGAGGQIDLFVVAYDGIVYTCERNRDGVWSGRAGWRPIGGVFPLGSSVAAVSSAPDQLELFITGNDGIVYTERRTPGADWSGLTGWRPIGGLFPVGAPIAAVSRRQDQLDLFVIGMNGVVYTSWWRAGADWSGLAGWQEIGGVFPVGI
jgi:hypothetical protein